ncbi:MAG TPA: outer membrane beta-barrel protein [Spirosoma sp.]|nr:outer membrane beta-barrel protein [Spirosoma sp.]
MKINKLFLAALLLLSAAATRGQTPASGIELGLKGGGTFTHGFTIVPAQTATGGVEVPKLENNSNGIGIGYTGGVWARKNFATFFIQAEVTYNRFVLKQKTNATLDINANPAIANALPVSVMPGLVNATLSITSESVLQALNVPVLFGKRFMDGRLRAYAGPNFIFFQKAEAKRVNSGQINANAAIGLSETPIPASGGTTNLLNKYEARNLEIKDFTYGLEFGAGFSPINRLDIDARYTVPFGGFYSDRTVKGFLGIATISLAYKIF